jgi:hypothetical protein
MNTNEIFVLTVNLPQRTRIQFGCANEFLTRTLEHAVATGTFYSFRLVNLDKLPKRSKPEMDRVDSFISDALDTNLTAIVKGH